MLSVFVFLDTAKVADFSKKIWCLQKSEGVSPDLYILLIFFS